MSQEQTKQSQNKMGVLPINKLLMTMALPMMASMLVQALYNIVDSIFVSKISEDALSAVSLAFPVQNLMIAIASGTGVGINAYLSRSLGENNRKNANRSATHGIVLAFLSSLLFVIFGLFFVRLFFESQSAENQAIVEYGIEYLEVCSILSLGLFGQVTFERLLQSTGKTFYAMITQGLGAVINLILDPILIFGYLGFPEMGVSGAALATVIGQFFAAALAIYFNITKNKELNLSFKRFVLHFKTIKIIYSVGIPSILMVSISSIMTFGLNKILIDFSSTAVAVLGVYFKLQSFVFMPIFGLNNGMIPIVAYNYGSLDPERIKKTIKLAVTYAISIMIVGFLIFQIFTEPLLRLFEASDEMIAIGIPALRVISLCFIPAGFCIIIVSNFQAFGKGILSLIVSVVRQLVVLLPTAFILSFFCENSYVTPIWFSFPIAELSGVVLSVLFFISVYKKVIKPLGTKKAMTE